MVDFLVSVLLTLLSPSWAADGPGPFHIHTPDEYASGIRQWSKVSDTFESMKQHFHGLSSSMGLPHPPQISSHRVKVSDDVYLSTTVINPYPYDAKKGAVIARSPYGPTSENVADIFVVTNGFAAVLQDDRGTFSSGGKFDLWRTARGDGLTTMEWVTSQPWSNGDVFTVGASADGINEATEVLSAPPMLKGQWWMWTTSNGHHFAYPGGAFRKDLMEGYLNLMNIEIHNAGSRVLEEGLEHEGYSDFWYNITVCQNQTLLHDPSCHWSNVKWPIVLSTGWWDIFQASSMDSWTGMRAASDVSVRDKHVHIISPLGHCTLSVLDVHPILAKAEAAATLAAQRIATEMFAGKFDGPNRARVGRINFFVMGGFDGPAFGSWNYWVSVDEWPAFTPKTFFLNARKTLSDAPPEQLCTAEYDYDPKNPAPMHGGNNLPIYPVSKISHCGHADQSSREARKDVIIFDSPPLSENTAVVGEIKAKLFVSSSANDTDFFVTLSDLSSHYLSSDKSTLIRYGIVRMRWRDSEIVQSPHMVPGNVYEANIRLASTAYVFPKGHRIRVSVSSAAVPYYNANSNTGKFDLLEKVTPVVAHNVVYMSAKYPSHIVLPTVAIKDIPENRNFPSITSSYALSVVV